MKRATIKLQQLVDAANAASGSHHLSGFAMDFVSPCCPECRTTIDVDVETREWKRCQCGYQLGGGVIAWVEKQLSGEDGSHEG